MSESSKTLLLVDGLSMAFRAFYALPVDSFATAAGDPTNAVYGFANMLTRLLAQHRPSHVAVAFDLPGGTFRTEKLPSYKGTRDDTPPELLSQIPLIRDLLKSLGVAAVDLPNYEADDLLATYARLGAEAGLQVLVVSGDRDTLQLVTPQVTVLYPRKGVSELTNFDPDTVFERHGVHPQQYPDLAALVGEVSDNLPGVPGVGPKTAAKWLATYGDLAGILAHADEIGGKVGESLRSHVDVVRLNRELNHLLPDLPPPLPLSALEFKGGKVAEIHALADALQFRTIREKLLQFAVDGPAESREPDQVADVTVTVVTDLSQLNDLMGYCALWVEGSGAVHGDAWALGVAQGNTAWAVDLLTLSPEAEAQLHSFLLGSGRDFYVHDAKTTWHRLRARGLPLPAVVLDTQLAAYLLQPDQRNFELEAVAERYLGRGLGAGEQGQLDFDDGELKRTAQAAHLVLGLATKLPAELDNASQKLLAEMEIPLARVLFQMEQIGIAVDTELLALQARETNDLVAEIASRAYAAIDNQQVNLSSPKQLQEVLFEQLQLPKTKAIKTGYTTDANALQELHRKHPHPFLEALLAHREANKLGQIIETLRQAVSPDSRIHSTFVQTQAATGRLSSRDPNLQNIPIRTEAGTRIRSAFVVGRDFDTLLTADYSQIEMRIMAHLSGDVDLISAFQAGEDLHRFVGARVFGVAPDEVDPGMRAQVKAMSYGLVYGLSAFGLAKQLGLSVSAAQQLVDDYFARFGAVRDYLESVVRTATAVGYTETIFGRRRYLPDLQSSNNQRREMARRAALNAPIQGSAADIIKRAMLQVEDRLTAAKLQSRQILQVHDELVLEIAAGELDQVTDIVVTEMQNAADLSVPLDVNVGLGSNWKVAGH